MGAKILIVDDEQNVVRWISYALKAKGYEVETAETGGEGLRKIQTEPPDLVILDVMMPDMSGTDVCQELRTHPATMGLPVIMLSGRARVPDKIKGLQSGADEYLAKPFETDEVVARIEALLNRTQQIRAVGSVRYGKVLGFIGAKGGVGTTTVALNVALALQLRGKNVIAAELRSSFGTMALQLGLTGSRSLFELLDLKPQDIDERQLSRRLVTHSSGMRALFGPQSAEACKDIKPDQAEAMIIGLSGMADYTIVDMPCYPSNVNWSVIQRCDLLTMVVESEPTCLTAGKVILDYLQSCGVSKERISAMVVRGGEDSSMTLSEITAQLGCEVGGIMTWARDLSLMALRKGSPLVLSHPESLVAGTLTDLADRFLEEKAVALSH